MELRMSSLRQIYGLGEPVRRGMELHCATLGWRPEMMGSPVGLDILRGTDTTLDVCDVYPGNDHSIGKTQASMTFHDELERGLKTAKQF